MSDQVQDREIETDLPARMDRLPWAEGGKLPPVEDRELN